MKEKRQTSRRLIQTLPTLILLILCGVTAIRSQEISPAQSKDSAEISRSIPAADDECAQLLDKTLDAFEKLKISFAALDAELATNKNLLVKEQAYNEQLLRAVALLTSSEKRDKSFFKKLQDALGDILKYATKPEHLATIAGLIVIIRNLK